MSHALNITRIRAVQNALKELAQEVVYIGGATVSLYADRPATEIRPTEDIDILVEIINYGGYAKLEENLRSKGFINDQESGVICRYRVQGIIVDVMPTNTNPLGFSNIWYPEGYKSSVEIDLGRDCIIKIFQSPYFLASKLEAFRSRGGNDGRMSTDFEDIVYILNNRNAIWDEINEAPLLVKEYLKEQFHQLLKNDYSYEWISAHLDHNEQRRLAHIISGLEHFIQ